MNQEVKTIDILEKAVVLGVISIAWSFLGYLMILASQKSNWFGFTILLIGFLSLLFVSIKGVIDISETYTDKLYEKIGTLKSGLICIAIAYIILLPPIYTLFSIFKS
ncbi:MULTISPECIES: hypothetical protein [Acinetobacter]|uniref:hypothetical protein n=1 Tax=Acinetobacter TaxID=469 RepID=UPI000B4C4479|nr:MULTISPECIES: hypothetical protein [Acinetobacter]MCR4532703.1 hypothetical protein [Acinetobacter venetianus]